MIRVYCLVILLSIVLGELSCQINHGTETGFQESPESLTETRSDTESVNPEEWPEQHTPEHPASSQEEQASEPSLPEPDSRVYDANAGDSSPTTEETTSPTDLRPSESTSTPDVVSVCPSPSQVFVFEQDKVTVSCQELPGTYRRYTVSTTHALRDNDPSQSQVQYEEGSGRSSLHIRTGHLLFDALFALAVHESLQNSVSSIQDGSFAKGQAVSCDCFQTGAKWPWAWTRDTAYAIDLALASFDPQRAQSTLFFKTSERKPNAGGGNAQIVQDTGTGGSWPVSSDRVVWALAAWRLTLFLDPNARTAFLQRAYPILRQTLLTDRKMVYDTQDGLYRGEQSFLDWREQSYPSWTEVNLWHIAMSKSLSTNILHYVALDVAANMAKILGKNTEEQELRAWSQSLQQQIQKKFAIPQTKLLGSMLTTTLDPAPPHKYDLLANALATLYNIADPQTARNIIETYPHSPYGPPVIWPQQPLVPIYHNRAIWPFVTAYWIRAAAHNQHAKAIRHNLYSLVRGAALNLSNMENLEFLSGANFVQDGKYSGPVVNSRRQLWSVAGYLSAVQDVLFGLQVSLEGIRFLPVIPRELRNQWLVDREATLRNFSYQGKTIHITLQFPPSGSDITGLYKIKQVLLNGQDVGTTWLKPSQLLATNDIIVRLEDPATTSPETLTLVQNHTDFRKFWSPREPSITEISLSGGKLQLKLDANGEQGVSHAIYRDGTRIADNITSGVWLDTTSTDHTTQSYCYTADSVFSTSGNRSHHSPPTCWMGEKQERSVFLPAYRFAAQGGRWGTSGSRETYLLWGNQQDTLEVAAFRPDWTGKSWLQVAYRNAVGGLTTGITCSTKRLQIWEIESNQKIAEHYLAFPQSGNLSEAWSTLAPVDLRADKTYRIRLDNDTLLHNMTYLQHFSIYTGGPGGGPDPWNQVEIQGMLFFPSQGQGTTRNTGNLVTFDGNNDLNKFKSEQILTPGVPIETWDRFALTWDQDWLYLAIVTKGWEQDLLAFQLYLETTQTAWSPNQTSTGLTYLSQTPHLPFSPNYLLGVRQKTNNQDGFGPWNGVWRLEQKQWILQTRFQPGVDFWVGHDKHTIAYKVHRAELGWPQKLRIVGHFVNTVTNQEWKLTVPSQHTPWTSHTTGFYEIDLQQSTAVSSWNRR